MRIGEERWKQGLGRRRDGWREGCHEEMGGEVETGFREEREVG